MRHILTRIGFTTGEIMVCLIVNGTKKQLKHIDKLVDDLKTAVPQAQLQAISLNDLEGDFDIVINATSTSLSGDALQLPEKLQFKYAYEMAYGKPSSFLDQAKQRNVPYAEGFGMLVGQAIEAFSIWNGVRPQLKDFL